MSALPAEKNEAKKPEPRPTLLDTDPLEWLRRQMLASLVSGPQSTNPLLLLNSYQSKAKPVELTPEEFGRRYLAACEGRDA